MRFSLSESQIEGIAAAALLATGVGAFVAVIRDSS